MAASWIQRPGTKFGPCKSLRCGHKDCESIRATAKAVCNMCGLEIGFERRFYKDDTHGVVHAPTTEGPFVGIGTKTSTPASRNRTGQVTVGFYVEGLGPELISQRIGCPLPPAPPAAIQPNESEVGR